MIQYDLKQLKQKQVRQTMLRIQKRLSRASGCEVTIRCMYDGELIAIGNLDDSPYDFWFHHEDKYGFLSLVKDPSKCITEYDRYREASQKPTVMIFKNNSVVCILFEGGIIQRNYVYLSYDDRGFIVTTLDNFSPEEM